MKKVEVCCEIDQNSLIDGLMDLPEDEIMSFVL